MAHTRGRPILVGIVLLVVGSYFLVSGVVSAKGFLAPLAVAGLLSMILLPVAGWLEKHGFNRGWSSLTCVFIGLGFFTGLIFLVILQGQHVAEDWSKIKERMQPKIEQVQSWVHEKTGISSSEQEQMLLNNSSGNEISGSSSDNASSESQEGSGNREEQSRVSSMPGSPLHLAKNIFSFLGIVVVTSVYVFFMMLYRSKLRKSILGFFNDREKPEAQKAISRAVELAQSYLTGRLILIAFLAVLYSVGLSIVGIRNAVIISLIAAFLTFIPYIGNLIGQVLGIAMAVFSGGDITVSIIGVLITFNVGQFIESYILEPFVVGRQVNLNPLMTIVAVVAGGAAWGIVGMVIVIPVFGIVKIVCDQVPVLHPVGYALGQEDIPQEEFLHRWGKKIKDLFG